MALVEFAGYPPSRVPGKAIHGEMSRQRHSATKLHGLLLEKLHMLHHEPGVGEAILGIGLRPGEAILVIGLGPGEAILVIGLGPGEVLPAAAK